MKRDTAPASSDHPAGKASRVVRQLLLPLAALGLLAISQPASADTTVCAPGAKAGQCESPRGLATDFETGLTYVADHGNNRIDVFKNGGTEPGTPASFGGVSGPIWIAVDNVAASASHHDVYSTTANFTVKKLEPGGALADEFGEEGDGTPEGCQLERANDPVAVGPGGDVYLADSYLKENSGGKSITANRIVKFDSAGNCIGTVPLFVGELPEGSLMVVNDLAVDSTGEIYVTVEGDFAAIRRYDGSGTLIKRFESLNTAGLAVDPADHLFAEQQGARVTKKQSDRFFTEYASVAAGGAILRRFGYANGSIPGSPGLAALHTTGGDLFASYSATTGESLFLGVRYLKLPPPGPVVFPEPCKVKDNAPGSVRATLQAEVNPEGKATEFKFEYLTQEQFEAEGNQFKNAQSSASVTLEEAGGGTATDFDLHEAAQTIEGLKAETSYRCRVVASNADSEGAGTVGEEGSFKTQEPFTFGAGWSAEVEATSALLNLEGNPNGAPTTAQVEYVTDASYQASGFKEALLAPEDPLDYGAGEKTILRSAQLTGLTPDTLYHYRLRATQPLFPQGITCPAQKEECPALEHTFRTSGPEEAGPDDRGWEMVSPPEKNSAEIVTALSPEYGGPLNAPGLDGVNGVLTQAAAASGEAATYTAWISFADPQSAPAASQYLSTRTPSGWKTANASPFGFQASLEYPPYLGFTSDLGFGAVKSAQAPLSADCPAEVEDLYFYEAATGSYRCLTPEAPASGSGKFGYCFIYGGASEDASRVFFKAKVRYANVPPGNGTSLYEFHEGQIHAVSVLPGQSEPTVPTPRTTFGMATGESCQTGQSVLHNAISADGAKAIWTYVPTSGPSSLLDRIDGSETIQLDAVQSGAGKSGNGTFWAASKDGGIVYFTSPNRLLKGAQAEAGAEDLYLYDFSKPAGSRLTDLSKGASPGAVKGVIGSSEDGQVAYFVAASALTPESEANAAAEHAEAGENNLYAFDLGEGKSRFIAQLSDEDSLDWERQPKNLTARVSPDGQHLAFLSSETPKLAGYDNTLAASGGRFDIGGCRQGRVNSPCPEAFIYDKPSASLTCASCNPTGSRPLGPTLFPAWSNMPEGPRYLSGDGSRLFFESFDRLLPGDENNLRDVYEFELPGAGSCTPQSPNFDPASGGCHFLVSSGKSADESYLMDASASGRDVFFSTRSALSGWDTDEHSDLYDYREGGGFPEPPPAAKACEGEASCTPPASAPPAAPASATPHFNGPGNPRSAKGKPHRKKHGRHHRKKQAKKGRAGR